MQLRYEMNVFRKENMSVEEYCLKVKAVADKLACAGSPVSEKDLLMQILNGLGPGFLDLASIITANRMSYDDAYALLLTHEAKLEQNENTKDLFNANYGMMNANYSQFRGNNRRGGYNGYQGQFKAVGRYTGNAGGRGQQMNAYAYKPMLNHRHNFNMINGSTSMSNGNGSDDNVLICQICHKAGHAANVCWHRHFDNYVLQPRQFGRGRGHKSAYMANNMANMHIRDQFTGANQLIIGNGQGLPITHVGDAFFLFKSSNSTHKHSLIALKDILLVSSITKNLLSISKLTTDNNLSVEFLGNVYFVKDSLRGQEPDSVQEALNDSKWLQAMKEEYDALIKNNTWTLVPRQVDQHVVGNKWVYRIKYNTNGSVAKYKARLVAKGFQQVAGVNYFETFSPVVKSTTVRVILSLAVMNQWRIRQVDVNNAFLNGELTEEVFMSQPDGFIDAQRSDFVCKLHKSLYGLKQAPRAWYDKLKGCLMSWGFTNTSSDTSLFVRRIKAFMIIVLIYVDDILITGLNTAELEGFITEFSKTFALKDLGVLSYFLGIEGELGYYLEDPTHYRSIVGGMQYLILTRPEIAFAVNKLSQSSAESEYRALASASAELTWLQSLFSELGISCTEKPIIWCDNISATELAKNPVYHSRTKHIEIDMHFIRNKVLAGELTIHYVPSEEQMADIMTKPLSFVRFNYLRSKLNVHLCPLSLRGAVRVAHYAEQKKVKAKMKKIQSKCVSSASSADNSAD
ncbi:retrovirus-related pol polyprotein from transposon RE2 [Citrus sinensis]|uniref:Retrovirus-related pol polyprotein from transposon RE2 n=3 Tax=Citrus sinensis TaxID=2711 RepID=A0ACB8L8E3_CITSI|nr:retrovirus-related pol polyprotein from transposon RE2 [Citrus sinensis]